MKLRSLTLWNFRQFYGEQTIIFASEPDKHITLIHGENTLGKSTVQNAVIWCLFGRTLDSLKQAKDLVNYEAWRDNDIFHCEVRLEFDYEGHSYEAKRTFNQKDLKQAFVLSQTDEDGNLRKVPNAIELINEIIPDDMATYFFFEGEGLGRMVQLKGTRDAIRSILGFRYAKTVVEDLSAYQRKLTTKLANEKTLPDKGQRLIKDLERHQKLEEEFGAKLEVAKQNEKKYHALYDNKVSELSASNHEEVRKSQKDLNQCQADTSQVNGELQRVEKKRQALVPKYGWAIFGRRMAMAADKMIDEKEVKGRVPAPHDEALVTDIIGEMKCICGRPITEHSPEYEAILALRMTASTGEIKRKITYARSQGLSAKGMYLEFLEEVEELEVRRQTLEQEKQRLQRKLETLKKKQSDFGEVNVQGLIKERDNYRAEWQSATRLINKTKVEIDDFRNIIKGRERDLISLQAQDKRLQRYQSQKRLIDLLQQRCEEKLKEFEHMAIDSLTEFNNNALKRISRQHLQLKLDQDLAVRYIDEFGIEPGRSRGENLLVNLIFVSSLINFARQRRAEKDDFVIHGTIAPFLLDAPLGDLDETYRKSAVNYIASSTDQLILLLSSSHWESIDSSIREKIGKEYILTNYQKEGRGERTDDVISINGVDYKQSLYDREKKYTKVMEIENGLD